ncbi:hypothetical protein PRIPAC_74854 [Pristionchus pacificus]|uniref:Uncharacterized protein n=1 Tax=Pristionchus pacificus TaxID=54126 RepID=A0A454Y143_PRIPA|nr:hypothetical protein PRIPAC_74854 [Pristionchus pacificus]|eukprot:PDM74383.1 hypothetical protein PRIPAC_41739 [Pristionchus pacificus]
MYADPWSQQPKTQAIATPVQKPLLQPTSDDLSMYWPCRFGLNDGLTEGLKEAPAQSSAPPLNAVGWPILASIWSDEPEPARHEEPEPAFAWNDKTGAPEEQSYERGCALSALPSLAFALPSLEPERDARPKLVEASQPSAEELLEASMHARVECVLDLIDDGDDDEVPEEEWEVKPVRTAYVNYRNTNNDDEYASDVESELEALMDDEFYDEDDCPTDERPYYLAMGIHPRFKLVPGPNEWAPPPPPSTTTPSARSERAFRAAPRHSRRPAPPPCTPSAEQAAAFVRFQARHHMQQLPEGPAFDDWHFIDRPTVLPAAHPTYRTPPTFPTYNTPPTFLPYPYPVSDLEVYPFLT